MPVCPGAFVTEMWAVLELPERLTVVVPLEFCTYRVNGAVCLLPSVKERGLAVSVQGPVVGGVGVGVAAGVGVGVGVDVGVGVGDGWQFTPLLLHGVGLGFGKGVGVALGLGVGVG